MADALSIARPYAKAAFSVAKKADQLVQWSFVLKELAIAVKTPEMQVILKNPSVDASQRCAILNAFSDKKEMHHFLALLAENKRLILLPDVSILFERMLAKESGYLALTVTSAFEMDVAAQKQTEVTLAKQFKSDVKIEFKVDPSLIGGMLVRSGNWVMDNTILGRLKKLKTVLM